VKASADAVEQQHSKLCLKGLNLPGRGGLGEIEARRRAMNASATITKLVHSAIASAFVFRSRPFEAHSELIHQSL